MFTWSQMSTVRICAFEFGDTIKWPIPLFCLPKIFEFTFQF